MGQRVMVVTEGKGRNGKKREEENEREWKGGEKRERVSFSWKPNLSGVFLRQQPALTGSPGTPLHGHSVWYLGTLCCTVTA